MRHLETFRLIAAVARAGSIRKAAEDANITASALNRRIARFEDEFGAPIFERLSRGVRLNPAGELVLQHFRAQQSDLQRLQSQVADLSGIRRGHVTIACSQALVPYFLPRQIAHYRRAHPGVTFSVNVRDREQAEHDLASFASDLALVFEPVHLVDFEVLHAVSQPVCAVLAEGHPLAAKTEVRLRDCLDHPHTAPSAKYGVRALLDAAAKKTARRVEPVVETESFELIRHYVLHEALVGFQIGIGLEAGHGTVARPIAVRDVPLGHLLLGQMKGRVLPVASRRFAQQVAAALEADEVQDHVPSGL
ncbi:LysR family transcriptional regulator [Meridianimarinicoccus aquatilis]|uniref:LysR family transcriptional regulator n=1 Tax=Meridianimarinicoccus aquatilis TaxID=2552766 RepID=A0A4V3BCC0_9RHOB|nr:LysR family transcriptional regulator [Fluviibacterium aquatile]TDL90369.1 LysR family transcriptional regulator [Fluviibacterium aquatile]